MLLEAFSEFSHAAAAEQGSHRRLTGLSPGGGAGGVTGTPHTSSSSSASSSRGRENLSGNIPSSSSESSSGMMSHSLSPESGNSNSNKAASCIEATRLLRIEHLHLACKALLILARFRGEHVKVKMPQDKDKNDVGVGGKGDVLVNEFLFCLI